MGLKEWIGKQTLRAYVVFTGFTGILAAVLWLIFQFVGIEGKLSIDALWTLVVCIVNYIMAYLFTRRERQGE